MIKLYKIELYEVSLVGYIIFNLNNNKINISFIHINQPGKNYGSFLLLIFMSYVINYIEPSLISGIYLDDCSDLSGTTQSIYYKFGLRILNKRRQEEIGIRFLKSLKRSVKISSSSDIPTAKIIIFNTFIDYYNSLLKIYNYNNHNFYFIVYDNNKKISIQKPDIREIPIFKRNTRQKH
jgi:hypothetical protein